MPWRTVTTRALRCAFGACVVAQETPCLAVTVFWKPPQISCDDPTLSPSQLLVLTQEASGPTLFHMGAKTVSSAEKRRTRRGPERTAARGSAAVGAGGAPQPAAAVHVPFHVQFQPVPRPVQPSPVDEAVGKAAELYERAALGYDAQRYDEARRLYSEALRTAPPSWPFQRLVCWNTHRSLCILSKQCGGVAEREQSRTAPLSRGVYDIYRASFTYADTYPIADERAG